MKSRNVGKTILSHPRDNVVTAKSLIKAGTVLHFPKGTKVKTKEEIPFGHKVALRKIAKGRAVVKYGEHIGKAVRTIAPGELVHTHNVEGERGKGRK
jgi:altronate dehydratase small subunit